DNKDPHYIYYIEKIQEIPLSKNYNNDDTAKNNNSVDSNKSTLNTHYYPLYYALIGCGIIISCVSLMLCFSQIYQTTI
ncbi:MAG TPA: hypothetical protein VLB80_02250, partial [Candidatus Babeliales bacterium]|nr:hypothetical protein [Candidatus Babeliales bacterium]